MITVHERKAAEAVVTIYWKRYGTQPFAVEAKTPNARALRLAVQKGWCWYPQPGKCALTREGVQQAVTHGGGR